ncbi:divergent polysaccharide deacetylase family protein [Shewanella sedimentimangrovi]|uniref:Divergent polysaccharide deacetylase family protein n=1 Tax=Shewanella sedimentimangrovi TaxID=2814293 RepID=A0ABX7R1H7_9GAMM|nr:divergent polysaccharide deacetylase family protein [Shewanella sedimentimangrovi]QSX37324.1 divergent polysaccharide deacetylase family protein [Shewanella sedimentimangrovi]
MRLIFVFLLLATGLTSAHAGQLAIIIDDIGYRQTDTAVLSLPPEVTLSVLPHTPLGKKLAQQGHQKGHEIMLHLPMQALNGDTLGPGGLTNQMSESQFKQQVAQAMDSVPYIKGVNNHMGSLLTQLPAPMSWLMEMLKSRELYFIDSATTKFSRGEEMAEQRGVPSLRRQLFLDNDISHKGLERQFRQLLELSKGPGMTVAIAHPHPTTVAFLKANLPSLSKEGIDLIPASQLLPLALARKQGTNPTAALK